MTTYHVGFRLKFIAEHASSDAAFEAVLDRFYSELLAIEEREADILDPDVAANLADMTAEVEMVIEAATIIDAQVRAIGTVRTALHTIEVGTPGWEAMFAGVSRPSPLELQDA